MNIVVFGVGEDRDTSVWRQFVLDAMEHVAGRAVETNDISELVALLSVKQDPLLSNCVLCGTVDCL